VSVCGPAPLLGCRPIRVRVESLYMYPISYQYTEFILLQFYEILYYPPFVCSELTYDCFELSQSKKLVKNPGSSPSVTAYTVVSIDLPP
jgi:hypothetical protein